MSIKKEFAKDSVIFGLGNGIKKFIGLFLLPFYTRALSPADYGILDSLATFAMFFSTFINVGLDSASGFYFFKAQSEEEKGKVLYTHLVLKLIAFIPPLILSLFSSQISQMLFKTTDYSWIVFVSIITIPINLLMNEQSHLYRYFRKPWHYNVITVVKSLVNICLGISLVLVLKWGIMGAQIATLVSSLVVVIGSFLLYTRKIYTYSFDWSWAKKMLTYGFPLLWSGLAGWVFNSSDRFFLLHYSSLEQIGYYSIGNAFSQPLLLINMAVQMSFGVLFYKIYNEEISIEKPDSKKMAIESFNLYLGIAIILGASLSVFGNELVTFVATERYSKGALAIPFLVFSAIAAQGFQSMGPGIEIKEKTWHFTWITAFTALLNIGMNFLFIPYLGFIGAALATLVSFICYWIIKVYIAHQYFSISYPFLKIGLVYFIGLAISLLFTFYHHPTSLIINFTIKVGSLFGLLILLFYLDLIPRNTIQFLLTRLKIKK